MKNREYQGFWAPGGATLRFPPRMRLAPSERERLWKGLERFVNCGDLEEDYQALGRAFPEFWPVRIWHYPLQEPGVFGSVGIPAIAATPLLLSDSDLDRQIEESLRLSESAELDWHKACHRLFLFYRDTLRTVWKGDEKAFWFCGGMAEFLLGLSARNEEAYQGAKQNRYLPFSFTLPSELFHSWRDILDQFSTAVEEGQLTVDMLWGCGDFYLVPRNDFQRAFYLLFRQSWRARVCPRCKMFFVARRPKQAFCGTVCSAGSRLASKRKWWRSIGRKNRKRKAHKFRIQKKK